MGLNAQILICPSLEVRMKGKQEWHTMPQAIFRLNRDEFMIHIGCYGDENPDGDDENPVFIKLKPLTARIKIYDMASCPTCDKERQVYPSEQMFYILAGELGKLSTRKDYKKHYKELWDHHKAIIKYMAELPADQPIVIQVS